MKTNDWSTARFSSTDLQLLEELWRARARESLLDFRRYIRPELKVNWWVREVAEKLQGFHNDFTAGRRPKLAIAAPPQHGKTSTIIDLIAYVAGCDPDKKCIYSSYGDELGIRANQEVQRIISSPRYQSIFGRTRINLPGWQCNSSVIEYAGFKGSFRNTTTGGAITGMELHLGIIDDPVKGSREAQSKLVRNRTWNWFTDDFCTRFAADSALLLIMTRWHIDDVLGRFIERFPDAEILRYAAIAEHDEQHRHAGEALFPELKPLDFLLERRKTMTEASWQSIYQQHPIIVGGGIFPIDKLRILPVMDRNQIKRSVRAWDKGSTHGGGDYTAGVLMHQMKDGSFVIGHVVRGQWSALEREEQIKATAAADKMNFQHQYEIVIEMEPGSGGKESYEATARNLTGYIVRPDKVTGSKQVRAEPFAAQVQAGNVGLYAGAHVPDLLDEFEMFPNGSHDDQVDAAAMAFARLTTGHAYLTDYALWL